MAEEICLVTKESVIIRSPKKSLVMSRMIVLAIAMCCSLYIFSVSLNQSKNRTNSGFVNIGVTERSCHDYGVDRSEIPYLHYPNPKTFRRAECACNPVRLFAILSMQRSGSGWFETLLNSHINVSSNGEIFSVQERRENISSIKMTLDRVYSLDWLSSASKNHCSAAIGFKWMLNQGLMEHHNGIVDYFKNHGVSVIFLLRRNLLRRMVSVLSNSYDQHAKVLNGTHKSHVHSSEEADALKSYKPEINPASFMMDLKQMEDTTKKALEYFNSTRHIVLFYEDLVRNQTRLVVDVQRFLGVPEMVLTSRQVKIHKGPLSEHIKNFDIIRNTLRGTTYESFLGTDY